MPPAGLPTTDPFNGQPYPDGSKLTSIIDRLRKVTDAHFTQTLMKLHPPRWGATLADVQALAPVLYARAQALIQQFDQRYPKEQLEVLPDVHN